MARRSVAGFGRRFRFPYAGKVLCFVEADGGVRLPLFLCSCFHCPYEVYSLGVCVGVEGRGAEKADEGLTAFAGEANGEG